jgi:DNA-binding NarL/FixJ family response regulator
MAPNPSLALALAGGPLRVHIATPDPLVRVALGRALELRRDVELADVDHADLILWDGGADPAAVEARLPELARAPRPVVALLPDERFVQAAVAAGARGALRRDADASSVLAALIATRLGLVVLDVGFQRAAPIPAEAIALTPREHEVLRQLAEGRSNKEIGRALAISDHTAKFHVNRILGKLGAQTRTEAVVQAARRGVLAL